ncbi:hypothetical protein DXD08_10650 [Lachnospiraceae bacterium TF10-8AT]|nr:hypothetical protein DW679_10725 [Lachnospiraceae bacterium AM25-27]RHU53070.1 hypothetical protein DXD08_10650 [Lachnospiraceae bacterium TF10-8AT]
MDTHNFILFIIRTIILFLILIYMNQKMNNIMKRTDIAQQTKHEVKKLFFSGIVLISILIIMSLFVIFKELVK